MKKLLIVFQTLVSIVFLSSCDNKNKPAENQSVSEQSMQASDTVSGVANQTAQTTQATQSEPAHKEERGPRSGEAKTAELSGQQIVENVSNKLNDKLNLSEEQHKSLTDILSKKLVETGGSLEAKYSSETSRKMARDLRAASAPAIAEILNPEQKEHFEKFMNK